MKRIVSIILALAMVLSGINIFPAKAEAKEMDLSDGMYYVELNEASKTEGPIIYNNFNVAPRAFLNVAGGNYILLARVYGYSHWNVIKMLSQEGWKQISRLSPGTDWKDYNGNEMPGYEEEVSADWITGEANPYWSTVGGDAGGSNKDMGMIVIPLENLEDAFALGGYATISHEGKELRELNMQGYQLDLNTLASAKELMYYAGGWSENGDFLLDYARTISGKTLDRYDSSDAIVGLFEDNFIEDTELAPDDGKIVAKFTVSSEAKEEIESIQVLEGRSLDRAFEEHEAYLDIFAFSRYLIGTCGNQYGENVYDAASRQFTVTFDNNDAENSLITGIDVKITTKQQPEGYRAVLYLSENGMQAVTLKDDATNASYTTYEKYVAGTTLTVKTGEEANTYALKDIKNVADGDNWRAYSFYLTDEDGKSHVPPKGGIVRVPIPKEWNLDHIYIAFYTSNGKNITTDSYNWQSCMNIVDTGEERYVEYAVQMNQWVADGTAVMCQVLKESDLSELSEDGVYNVTAKFVKAGAEGILSMADGSLERDAVVAVKDGKKSIYMDFHPLEMVPGTYSYIGAIWNKEASDCVCYDYETESDGTLIDNAGFDAVTEFPCVKSVKIELSDDTISGNSYKMQVVPPAMAAGNSYEKVIDDSIDVDLKLYNIKKAADASAVQIPTYQKSVLRRAIDKAGRYQESSYSSSSWAELKAALEAGKAYYASLAGKDAGTDAAVSGLIYERSNAIEEALKGLEENQELAAAREGLKEAIDEAEQVELGNKTVSAFQELAAEIRAAQAAYRRPNVTIEELNAQANALHAAVETFYKSADASQLDPAKLEDGEYKVYADMKKVDKEADSMANNAIDHWIKISVKDGAYTAVLDFKGMTISGQFGYLMNLGYYDAGYSYSSTGEPIGTLKAAEVLATQKNADGSDVIDSFNDKDSLYPDILSFPLVDKGEQEYVPLQVYVPIMESITAGTGTQNVLMKVDWTSLKYADDDAQEPVSFENDGIYTVSSSIRESSTGDASIYSNYLQKARLSVEAGQVKVYLDLQGMAENGGEKYIEELTVLDGDGNPVALEATADQGKITRAVFTLPSNVELTDIRLKDSSNAEFAGRLYLGLSSAVLCTADKAALKSFIDDASAVLKDGKDYTAASRETLKKALAAAEAVYQDPVSISTEISSVGIALKSALGAMEEANTGQVADGFYEIKAEILNATNPSQYSMADGALEKDENGNKKPLYLEVKDGAAALRMRFSPLTIDFGSAQYTGYLGELKYLAYEDTDTVPTDAEQAYDAAVGAYYQVYDGHNDPDFGTDAYMKGKQYPEQITIPVGLNDPEIWIKVYVPVMESIQAGSGSQYARLRLDWSDSGLKQVRDESIDISKLEDQIAYAKTVQKGNASDKAWESLQQVILSAQAVYESLSSTQEQIDDQVSYLQKAIAAVDEENSATVDKAALQQAIAKANGLAAQSAVYTAGSIAALKQAIVKAQETYSNGNASQADVDAQVTALNKAMAALVKQQDNATPVVAKPSAPSSVKASSAAYNKVKVTWKKVSGANGYEVYLYNSSTKKYSRAATVTGTSYTKGSLQTGNKYRFKVRAFKTVNGSKVYSSYSTAVSAKPALSAAASVKAQNSKSKAAVISWKRVPGASGYLVYRSTKKTTGFQKVTAIKKSNTVKYTNKKLKKGTTYYYKVRAYRTVGGKKVYASYSKTVKVNIKK